MAITAEAPNRVVTVGAGTTGPFNTPQYIAAADLLVIRTVNATGAETVLTLNALTDGYTVDSGGSGSAGTITTSESVASTHSITVINDPSITQDLTLSDNVRFPAGPINDALDRLTFLVRRLDDRMSRSLELVDTAATPSARVTVPSLVSGQYLKVNTDAAGFDLADGTGQWLSGAGAPSDDDDGENGDMYLDTSSGDVYGPKASGAWGSSVANLKGPSGDGGEPDDGSVTAAKLADDDFGDFSVTSSVATLSDGAVDTAQLEDGAVSFAKLASSAIAAASDWRANTASKLLDANGVWDAMAEATLTDAATVAWDMDDGFDFTVTLGGSRTMGNPTNAKVGQKGRLRVVQDGTGSRTLSWSSNFEAAGGSFPSLTATASAEDVLYYDVISSTRILITQGALDIS